MIGKPWVIGKRNDDVTTGCINGVVDTLHVIAANGLVDNRIRNLSISLKSIQAARFENTHPPRLKSNGRVGNFLEYFRESANILL